MKNINFTNQKIFENTVITTKIHQAQIPNKPSGTLKHPKSSNPDTKVTNPLPLDIVQPKSKSTSTYSLTPQKTCEARFGGKN